MHGSQGALSSVQLQAHYDEISSQMSVLPLSILPRPIASSLGSLDAVAAKLAKRAAAGLTECQVCSCSCSSPDQLHLQFTTRLEFHSRAVHATAARFVCGQCAAVSSCSLLLQLATPHVGAEVDEERSQHLLQLQLHFAALNNAPASITSNADSLALWVQELACRAYSMTVVANSLKGWKLQPEGASTAQILQQLLQLPGKKLHGRHAAVAAAGAGAGAGAGQRKKLSKGRHAGQAQEQDTQDTPAAGSKRASSAHTAAQHAGDAGASTAVKQHKKARVQAEAAAAAQEPTAQPTPGSMKQQPSSKKHKHGSAAPGSNTPATPADAKQHSSSKKHKHAAAAPGSGNHATPSGSKQPSSRQGVVADAGLRTPQHGKVKMSSSKKQKLLKSAPR